MKAHTIFLSLIIIFDLLLFAAGNCQETGDYYRTTDSLDAYYLANPGITNEPEGGYIQYIRWKEFWRNRVYGADTVRKGSQKSWLEAIERYQQEKDGFTQTPIGSFWYQTGPKLQRTQLSGLVSSVYVDTLKDKTLNTIYIGTNASGIWKTTNGGQDWVNITDYMGFPNLGITHITGDPNTVDVIYAASGGNKLERPDLSAGYGVGILKTTDGGYSWTRIMTLYPPDNNSVYKLLVDPSNSDRIYALIDSCVYRTVDGGENWKIIFNLLFKYSNYDDNKWLRDIEMNPANPDVLYIASDDFNGWHNTAIAEVWKTNNATSDIPTWQRIDTLLLMPPSDTVKRTTERYEIEVCPKDPDAVWILCKDYNNSNKKIWKSYDSGDTWSLKFDGLLDGGIDYHRLGMKISPVDTGIVYCFGYWASKLIHWINDSTPYTGHVDVRSSFVVNRSNNSMPDTLFVGNDGGISTSIDSFYDWINLNGENLIMTQFWGIGGSRKNPYELYGGTVDNNFFTSKANIWSNIDCGDFGDVIVSADSTNYLFTNRWNSGNSGYVVLRSSDRGITFDLSRTPTGNEATIFNRPLATIAQNPRAIMTGGHHLHKSTDRGNTYDTIYVPPDIKTAETIGSICVSPSDSNVIYLAFTGPHWGQDSSSHKLLRTIDHGKSWTNLANSLPVLTSQGITGIAINPNYPDSVWIALGGFTKWYQQTMVKKVYFSSDSGTSWKDISQGLPDMPVNCIKYSKIGNGGLFVGTDVGVFYRPNSDTMWLPFNNNLPQCIITDLEINDSIDYIRAATFGRGIWESDLSCPFSPEPLVISQNTSWTIDTVMDRSIVVDSLATFTIYGKVSFPYQAKIYVKQGGKLIVDGGHLTNACFNNWQGIEVWGNKDLSPYPPTNQGYALLKNGAVIEHARIGVSTCRTDSAGRFLWNTTGGIVVTDQAVFQNNYKAIALLSYPRNQVSNFNRTIFQTTQKHIDANGDSPSDFVSMFEVKGVRFFGCTFRNTTDTNAIPTLQKGQGIYSINSQYYVDSWCNSVVQPCPDDSITPSIFKGLHYGIKQLNYRPIECLRINKTKFLDNYRGVYLSATDFAEVTSNEFKVPKFGNLTAKELDTCYGLYLGNCTAYHVEDNQFYVNNNTLETQVPQMNIREIGIVVDNSGGAPNEIYRNRFDSLDLAINAQRCNRDNDKPSGLVLKCNTYYNNSYDEMITRENDIGVEGIALNQGDPNPATRVDLAGNTFSPYHETAQIPESDIRNEGEILFYFHHVQDLYTNAPRVKPEFCDTNVVKARAKSFEYDTTGGCCPPKLDSQGSSEDLRESMESEQEQIDSLQLIYSILVDGGNTGELTDDILLSSPSDALSLYEDLIDVSPYLSDTVINAAISKEEVLPNVMIRDIMVANPQSAKSDETLNQLDSRFTPMPDGMVDEILQGQSTLSAKEELQGKMSARELAKSNIFSNLLRFYKTDTMNAYAQDSVNQLLQHDNKLVSKYMLVSEYLVSGDTVAANLLLESIPVNFELSSEQELQHEKYVEFFGLMKQLSVQNKPIFDASQEQLEILENLVLFSKEPLKSYARNILIANMSCVYKEPILLPDFTKAGKTFKKRSFSKPNQESYFTIYPNPAQNYIVINYNLHFDNAKFTDYYIVTTNNLAKQVDKVILNKDKEQILINIENYNTGTHICSLINHEKVLQSVVFVVSK